MRDFECDTCKKKFGTNPALKNHISAVHLNLKCEFAAKTLALLIRHTIKLHGHTQCVGCRQVFESEDILQRHNEDEHDGDIEINKKDDVDDEKQLVEGSILVASDGFLAAVPGFPPQGTMSINDDLTLSTPATPKLKMNQNQSCLKNGETAIITRHATLNCLKSVSQIFS
jgi:hypothetical protein